MSKVDWGNLRIVEEWSPTDPRDPNAVTAQQERTKTLSALILKAFRRYEIAKAKRNKGSATLNRKREGVGR